MKTQFKRILSFFLVLILAAEVSPLFTRTAQGDGNSAKSFLHLSADAASVDYSDLTPNEYLAKILLNHNYNGIMKNDNVANDMYRYYMNEGNKKAELYMEYLVSSKDLGNQLKAYGIYTFSPSDLLNETENVYDTYAGIILAVLGVEVGDTLTNDYIGCATNKSFLSVMKTLTKITNTGIESQKLIDMGKNPMKSLSAVDKKLLTDTLTKNNKVYKISSEVGDNLKFISNVIKYSKCAEDVVLAICEYDQLRQESQGIVNVLKAMRERARSVDMVMYQALDRVVGIATGIISDDSILADAVLKSFGVTFMGDLLDEWWTKCLVAIAGQYGLVFSVAQSIWKVLAANKGQIKNKLIAMLELHDFSVVLKNVVFDFAEKYKSNSNFKTASDFLEAIHLLLKSWDLATDYCIEMNDLLCDKHKDSEEYKKYNRILSEGKSINDRRRDFFYLPIYYSVYKADAPVGAMESFESLEANGYGMTEITTEQLDAVCEKYGYKNGVYWTYKSGGSSKNGYMASNRARRDCSYSYNGIECYGFANFVMHEVTGTNVYPGAGNKDGWVKLAPSQVTALKVGDIVRIGKNDSNGHSGIVYTNNNGKCTFLQCLGSKDNLISKGKALAGTKALNNGYKSYSTLSAMKDDNALVYVYRYIGSGTSSAAGNKKTVSYTAGTYKVTAKAGLAIRKSPTKNSTQLGGYAYGTVVTVSSVSSNWGKTDKGWICLDYTKKESGAAPVNTYYNPSSNYSVGSYIVTAKAGLRIRQSASAASNRLGAYKYNAVVNVLATNGNWGQTDRGWICLDYTRFVSTLKSEIFRDVHYDIGVYKASDPAGLNYRSGAGTDAPKLGTIRQDTEFEIVTVDGSWGYCNELGGWLCLNYAAYVRALPVRLPVPAAPGLVSSTPSELPVGDMITVEWAACENADSYKATLSDASNNAVLETKEGLTDTAVSFVTPHAGTYNVNVVSVNAQHESPVSNMNGFEAKAPVTVAFKDWDGAVLSAQTVKYGADAVAPAAPERNGYTFTGWTGDFTGVRSNIDITANYTRKSYKVTFYDFDGTTVVNTQNVLFEDGASAPAYTAPAGYTFVKWDHDFSSITADTDVKAVRRWTSRYPLEISAASGIYRNNTNYITTAIVNNSPDAVTDAKVIVSLKTAEGKELAEVFSDNLSLAAGEVRTLTLTASYDGAATVGNIFVVKADDENIPLADNLTVSVDPGTSWSPWSTDVPSADALQTESRTEYQYRTKAYTTSSGDTLSGWTKYDTSWAYSAWSGWSAWQDAAVSGNDLTEVKTQTVTDTSQITWGSWSGWQDAPIAASALCEVETQQVPASYKTIYHYYYYTKTNKETDGLTSYYKNSNYPYGPWKVTFDSELPTTTSGTAVPVTKYQWNNHHNTGKYMYVYADDPYTTNGDAASYKTQYRCRTGTYGTKTQYSYRTRTLDYTYYYFKWSAWSDWSTEPQTATADREINTRTVYRYVSNAAANLEDNTGESRTVSGNLGADYQNSNVILHIFAADGTTQYIGQTTVGPDGSYRFVFKLKNEPTVESGDYSAALSMEGTTAAIALDPIPAPVPSYTVTFKADDGSILETQQIRKGENAAMPQAPEKAGYTFTGWDGSGTNIQKDTVITAAYEKQRFEVVFADWLNGTTETGSFFYGDALVPPEPEECSEAYTFLGWDAILDGRTTVAENMVVSAVYEKKTFTVNFYGYDNALLAAYHLEYGDGLVAPEPEQDGVHIFAAWNTDADFNYITENLDIYPLYCYEETVARPTVSLTSGEYAKAQTVTLSCGTAGAQIYYTTDGSDPLADAASAGPDMSPVNPAMNGAACRGTLYTGPFTIDSSVELTFAAVKDNMNSSGYETAVYAVNTSASGAKKHLVSVHDNLSGAEYAILADHGALADIVSEEETEAGYTLKGVYTDAAHTKPWNPETDKVTESMDLYVEWQENTYTVTFLDMEENVLGTQTVPFLGSAIPPAVPDVAGYTFTGWDADYSAVYEDLDVHALYVEKSSVTDIALSATELLLDNGVTSAKLTATVSLASGAVNDHVIWQSEDEAIATVDDDGVVTAHREGLVNIYAISEDSGMAAQCAVRYALGCIHSFTEERKAATCTKEGYIKSSCSKCGATTTEKLEKLPHTPAVRPGAPATCTDPGRTDETVCSVCHTVLKASQTIPSTDHRDQNGDGICDVCGKALHSGGNPQESNCVCGKVHTGPFAGIIKFFHRISYFFKNMFRK